MAALQPQHLAQWQDLRHRVLRALCHPDAYAREPDEAVFFAQHTAPRGVCLGVWDAQQLVAYAMLRVAAPDAADSLADAAGLHQTGPCAQLSSCMVDPQWQGRGLQTALLGERLRLAQQWGLPVCLAMVSLHNPRSRRNLLAQGFALVWTGWIDGLQRHVMAKGLLHAAAAHSSPEHALWCPADDFEALRNLAQKGMYANAEAQAWGRSWLQFNKGAVGVSASAR